ncbi:hypothetical protein DPMN_146843 [Dreissena polymorpha]|uniref:Uncharacterized protein n=1 Tax=Dreissena polymorpha TaxID=45954 RepID=A0A9D4FB28_DREPO|nr:hypothetical protein DPMN_146843 [Dreissena polymorpha]
MYVFKQGLKLNNDYARLLDIIHNNYTPLILQDEADFGGAAKFNFPIIADPKRELAVQLGMLDPDERTAAGLPLTCRAVH